MPVAPWVGVTASLAEARAALDRARELLDAVDGSDARVADLESDRAALSEQLAASEQQISQLMNLYVATYQLHATLDLGEVKATIGEIASNVLGAEHFALLFWQVDGSACEITLAQGEMPELFAAEAYGGGDAAVDATLADGVMRLGPIDGSSALAVVPLAVQGQTLGALVILKLLDHRPPLGQEDREMLDLLAAHAASALVAAGSYAQADRKLRSLRSVLGLVSR